MHCFGGGWKWRREIVATATATAEEEEEEEDKEDERENRNNTTTMTMTRRRTGEPEDITESPASTTSASQSPTTINLTREYTLAVQTKSYEEIWSKIHRHDGSDDPALSSHLVADVLHPDPGAVAAALSSAPPTRLSRLVSSYMDSSERTSHLFLSLRRSLDQARSLYRPIADLLDLLPSSHLSQAQQDWALDAFLHFHRLDNPFPAPTDGDAGGGFAGMRSCFLDLRQQLDARLILTRRKHRLLRRSTLGAAACLVCSVAGLAVAVPIIATHALAALLAAPALCLPPRDPLEGWRRRQREHMAQLDAAARNAYVLHNDLDTIERLVARLYATVESDKALVRLGLEPGPGNCRPIEEVLQQLRKNQPALLHQLRDLDEHVVLCFTAVNRARSLLLEHLHHHRRHSF